MATVTKYAIEKIDTGERVRTFSTLPKSLNLPDGRRVVSPVAVGDEGLGYRLIQIDEVDFAQPGTYYTQGADTETREGAVITVTRAWTAWTQAEIDAYEAARKQRIADQFDDVNDIVRVAVLALQGELNRTNRIVEALGMAIVQGTSLADIKTRIQAMAEMPRETTPEQLKAFIEEALGL